MPRLMTFAKTADQFLDGSKIVTRRDGWLTLKPGVIIEGIDRSPRSGKGFERLGLAIVEHVRRERLGDITPQDVALEGFPGRSPKWFVEMYCGAKPDPGRIVTRILFTECETCERRAAWKCSECGLCLCNSHARNPDRCRLCSRFAYQSAVAAVAMGQIARVYWEGL